MNDSELISLVEARLLSDVTVVNCHEVILVQRWLKMTRIIAIVNHKSTHAVMVFNSSSFPPASPDNLILEHSLPIDLDFQFVINYDSKEDGNGIIYFISHENVKLDFEMVPSMKTNNFAADLTKLQQDVMKDAFALLDFSWLSKYDFSYTKSGTDDKEETADLFSVDSPDGLPPAELSSRAAPHFRDNFIRIEMSKKEEIYTYAQPIRIFIGTWNVNGQGATIGLSDWLACDKDPPDIVVVGFQELDLSKEAYLFNDSPKEAEWLDAVKRGLHPGAKYNRKALVRLVGMMLIVFVQQKLAPYVKDIAVDTVGTGIMGKLGNKGGVAVRMDVHNTSMCFVNSHLAAHVEEYERRNQDYRDIVSRTTFNMFFPPKHIKDHEQIYWLGDLNYRITDLDLRIVKEFIDMEDYERLLVYDQLMIQLKQERVFEGFKEGTISFKPTYKYDVGTDNWDSSEKSRAPAWCDRVLWKGDKIEQLLYRSHPIMRISDHKPVSALFESQIRVVDDTKFRKVYEEVMKKLDKMENEGLPQVTVDTNEIIFDTLRFLEPQSRELTIANTGHSPVHFEFIKKLGEETFCKEWLRIEPYVGYIMPGDTAYIKLEVYVDKKSAFKLNSGEYKLYDILVLHLFGGKDIFITVTGNYERSCFGYSIETLICINVPVKELQVGKLMDLENKRKNVPECMVTGYTVPKEIWFLVDHLYRHALKHPHLFEHPGLHSEILLIRDWLDFGSQESLPGSSHSVAEALLLLLESTSEPVIPYHRHQECLAAASNYMQCKQILLQLPDVSRNIFIYLCLFLQDLLLHSSENLLDAKTIASLFGVIFLRDNPKSKSSTRSRSAQMMNDRKKAHFVYHFLMNDISDLLNNSPP